jgi:alkylation response protein AidB-like acyl-CoA dehydrogenase
MPLDYTVEQCDLRDAVRALLVDRRGVSTWKQLVELGLTEIPYPERLGGAGGTVKDAAVVIAELGRVLDDAPFLTSAIAGLTLLLAGGEATQSHLRPIVAGERIAALVNLSGPALRAEVAGAHLLLTGTAETVLGADVADVLVVVASTAAGPELAVIDAGADGVSRRTLTSLDLTRPVARVEFAGAAAVRCTGPRPPDGFARARSAGLALLAAEQVAAAEQCLKISVEYACIRTQFDRPIGSFQAIKHRLVDMHVAVELAGVAVLDALDALDQNRPARDTAAAASTARALACDAFTYAAAEAIQVHGGIGFTWEHPLHHYFRRARTGELLYGTAAAHRRQVGAAALAAVKSNF